MSRIRRSWFFFMAVYSLFTMFLHLMPTYVKIQLQTAHSARLLTNEKVKATCIFSIVLNKMFLWQQKQRMPHVFFFSPFINVHFQQIIRMSLLFLLSPLPHFDIDLEHPWRIFPLSPSPWSEFYLLINRLRTPLRKSEGRAVIHISRMREETVQDHRHLRRQQSRTSTLKFSSEWKRRRKNVFCFH